MSILSVKILGWSRLKGISGDYLVQSKGSLQDNHVSSFLKDAMVRK